MLINLFCELKKEDKVNALINQMKSQNISLSPKIYNSLIHMYSKLHRPEDAMKVFDNMKKDSLRPDAHTYWYYLS